MRGWSVYSSKSPQHMPPMILASKEDGQNADNLCLFMDSEIKYGPTLCDATQSRRQFRQKRSLLRDERDRVDLCFDQACACRSSVNGVRQGITQADVGIHQMSEDRTEISVAVERPDNLKGHRTFLFRQLCLRDAGDFLLDSRMRLLAARRSTLSSPQVPPSSIRFRHVRALGLAERPHLNSNIGHPRRAVERTHPADRKSKQMLSRSLMASPWLAAEYYPVAPRSISDGAP